MGNPFSATCQIINCTGADLISRIIIRPKRKCSFNNKTQLFVLWVNYLFDPTGPAGEFAHSRYLTATSPVAAGPFTIRNANVSTLHWPPGDYSIWPDEDGSAYIIYTSISTHQMNVEKLTADWLKFTLRLKRADAISTPPPGPT